MKKIFIITIFVITILLAAALAFSRFRSGDKTYSVDVSRAAVVTQLRALNRYETASFTIEKIIDASVTQNGALNEWLFGDRILLIAHGEVIAGFDLSALSENDVTFTAERISITLPAPQILITRLDSERTRVYDRRQGLLTNGDRDLESEARQAAEDSIRQAACQGKILSTAATNADTQLTTILKSLGFTEVEVIIPEGSC